MGIEESPEFLEKFFRNLLLGERNELKNRFCHIRSENLPVNAKIAEKTDKILPVNLPENKTQRAILALLNENNRYTYDELAEKLCKTQETVRANLRILKKKRTAGTLFFNYYFSTDMPPTPNIKSLFFSQIFQKFPKKSKTVRKLLTTRK